MAMQAAKRANVSCKMLSWVYFLNEIIDSLSLYQMYRVLTF